jgi:eukaryotic-like serine/threonine-protein kinase
VSGAIPTDPPPADADALPESVERYLVFDEIGVGGMASVHIGMLTGAVGFRRIVALKQLHARFIHDPDFVSQFINEARLAARIHHAHVVQTLDVVWTGTQLMLVLEYVDGDTLNRVLRSAVERRQQLPMEIACSMVTGLLHGLHAAHEVRDEEGAPLDIVHRDVSPQNILIGRDGIARVLDFGVAKALAQSPATQTGLLKGKFGYMAPEQIMRGQVDRRTDVFAAGVVLWEALTCRRLFQASRNIEQAMSRVVAGDIPPPSAHRPGIPPVLDAIVLKAMARDVDRRFQSAEELAEAIENSVPVASPHLVKTWFGPLESDELKQRSELIRSINKRYGTPGRSTPRPNELEEEARAARNSSSEIEERRRSAEAVLSSGSYSGNFAHDPSSSSGGSKPGSRTLPPRRAPTLPRLHPGAALAASAHGSGGQGSNFLQRAPLSGLPWLTARNVGSALLTLVLLMATWVTAIGWHDQPPTSERLRQRRIAALRAAAPTGARQGSPGAQKNRGNGDEAAGHDSASGAARREPGPGGALRNGSTNEPADLRGKPDERPTAPGSPSELELRLSR